MFKRVTAVVAALALTVGMSTATFADSWTSYFGQSEGWYEGALGKLTAKSDTGWSAKMDIIGWGGIWGCQVKRKVSIKKGKKYEIKYTLKSSKLDKWAYLKIASNDKASGLSLGKWVRLKKGKAQTVSATFTAKTDVKEIVFGLGGENGDREGVDKDAKIRYAQAGGVKKIKANPDAGPSGDLAGQATVVTCSGFSLAEASGGSSSNNNKVEETTTASTISNNDSDTTDSGSTDTSASTSTTVDNGTTSTVATGDFTPVQCAAAAIAAGAVIVLFARKRETR